MVTIWATFGKIGLLFNLLSGHSDCDQVAPEAGFLNNFFHESCNFQIKVATLKFLGFLNKAISSEGFNFVAACLNGFFKHFFTP